MLRAFVIYLVFVAGVFASEGDQDQLLRISTASLVVTSIGTLFALIAVVISSISLYFLTQKEDRKQI